MKNCIIKIEDLKEEIKKFAITGQISAPKVSIIIPTFNNEQYLPKCLLSVIKQSLKEIEIIVVNDGSTDNSENILKVFTESDNRFKIINQDKNEGVSAARNIGIEIATGEFISFIDSDDWVDENFIEKLYMAVKENNCDIGAATIIRKRKNIQKYRVHYTEEKIVETLEDKIKICKIPTCCYIWNKIYKTNFIKNFKFQVGTFFEDILWIPEVLKQSNKLITVPDTNYYYRVNNNSIVKKTPSNIKQKNSYTAKKYIVKFFEQNNLKLSEKDKDITKRSFYFYKFLLLKIKEKQYLNTCYLFGFLPIFKFTDFDAHYIFKIFGIRIALRHKSIQSFNYIKADEYGVTKTKRSPQLIVSLTTHTKRINYVAIAINTLLRQSLKPDRIILWLAEDECPELPEELLNLQQFGLEIKRCPNYMSYKKIVPALKEFPEDIIVTADDDLYYAEDWLKSLYSAYLKNPANIYVKRAVRMKFDNQKILPVYLRDEAVRINYLDSSFSNQLMSGSGCLFPPKCLHMDIFDSNKFLQLLPTHDDIYLWVMAILNNTKIEVIDGYSEEMLSIDGTIESSLCKINNNQGFGMLPEKAFAIILKEYPQIKDILSKENY